MMTQKEAVAVLEHVAQAIENGTFSLNQEMKQFLGDQYAGDLAISVPYTMRKAIETLKDPDRTSQTVETADQQ